MHGALAVLLAALAGCGDDAPAASPTGAPATPTRVAETPSEGPGPAGQDEPPPPPNDPRPQEDVPPAASPRTLALGGDGEGLLVLDLSTGEVTRHAVGDVQSAVWLGCGSRMAYRSANGRIAVVEADGSEVASQPVPDFAARHGDQLARRLARAWLNEVTDATVAEAESALETMRGAGQLEVLLRPGPLVRTPVGRLALDPIVDIELLNAEEVGCRSRSAALRLHLRFDEVPAAPCDGVELDEIRAPAGGDARPPAGFRCRHLRPSDDDPAWRVVRAGTPRVRRDEELGQHTAYDLPVAGVTVCEPTGAPSFQVVAVAPEEAMGCMPSSALFVLVDGDLVAETGWNGRILAHGDTRFFGGDRQWYVMRGGGAVQTFGRIPPDVVTAP